MTDVTTADDAADLVPVTVCLTASQAALLEQVAAHLRTTLAVPPSDNEVADAVFTIGLDAVCRTANIINLLDQDPT